MENLKIGDTVSYINVYGVTLQPRTVTGFVTDKNDPFYGRVYIDSDSPWFPVEAGRLKKI